MKRISARATLVAYLLSFVANAAQAEPIDAAQARAIAAKVLAGKQLAQLPEAHKAAARAMHAADAEPAFYVFNAEAGGGFVMVSGDDAAGRVLAYSHSGSFDAGSMPGALRQRLEWWTQTVENVRSGRADAPTRASVEPGKVVVDALCQTQWGQDSPFNLYCPKFGSTYAPCGCVATAMAQIMKYHQGPRRPAAASPTTARTTEC